MPILDPGDEAPGFSLPDQDGNPFSPADARGSWLVLYFYPRADTPGCTAQACSIRDRSAEYDRAGARVAGVSPDETEAVARFAAKYDLDFTLLADASHEVSELYGTWVEKNMYGKKRWGVERTTFLIDPDGRIARIFPKVSPKSHDDDVLEALAALA